MTDVKILSEAERSFLEEKAHHYFMEKGYSCGLTLLHCLSDLLRFPLNEQVYAAMNGVLEDRDYRDQCGLYKGTLMFIGIYGTALGWDRPKINAATKAFALAMEKDFGSLKCYDLRGGKFKPTEPHDKCAPLTAKAVVYAASYVKGLS